MRVVVASTTVPHVRGGGLLIAEWTAQALREAGHEVEEFYLPFPQTARPSLSALVGLRATPLQGAGERLIAIRWPAHLIRHDNKATWFIHHYRAFFDLWDTPFRQVKDNAEGRAYREAFRRIDNQGLGESRELFTNSLIVRDRVREFNGLDAEPLFPPLGGDTTRFRTESYGDFILYPSRVTPIKRQMLAVEAMRYTASGVRLVIAGRPDPAGYAEKMKSFVREHGLEHKVTFRFGWVEEDEKVDLLANCLAVAYLPVDEDSYGYTSLEASHSSKPIVTLADAGGALEFVRDGVEGYVAEPDARSVAAAFDRLHDDRDGAQRMGEASARRRAELNISWEHTIDRLLGDDR